MTYDPVDTNNDGIVDADVDNQSVSTDEVSDGSTGSTVYDGSTETLGDGTQTGDLQSLNTDEATIDGQLFDKVDTFSQSGTTANAVTADFSGLTYGQKYYAKFDVQMQDPGEIHVHFGGSNSVGNGLYTYFDETGARKTGQDRIVFVDTDTVFTRVRGISPVHIGALSGIGLGNLTGQIGRWVGWAQQGATAETQPDPSVQFTFTGGLNDGGTVEIWEAL